MLWYQSVFKPVSAKFVRQSIGPITFGDKPCSSEDKKATVDEILKLILPKLEAHLD